MDGRKILVSDEQFNIAVNLEGSTNVFTLVACNKAGKKLRIFAVTYQELNSKVGDFNKSSNQ